MPTLKRPCPGRCGRLIASPVVRCPACARAVDQARGTPTARGFGYEYQAKRRRILARDGYVCHLCGQHRADSVDHLVPRSRGGTNEDSNLAAAHLSCNSARGARIIASPKSLNPWLVRRAIPLRRASVNPVGRSDPEERAGGV